MTISPPEEHLDVHVLVHTHWDREWYRPEPLFRQRLVTLVDKILDRAGTEPFLLDGQAALLEDYLSARPERAADVSAALRSGAIEAGPWYVLADELIPSGEGLVRNLLAGRRVLKSLRATAPPVLYCPDSFGHPAGLPSIAAGFGFATIVLWRGFGGARHPQRDTVRWRGPDGSTVLLYHLPPDGYEFGSHLPAEPSEALERWSAMRSILAPRATTGIVLVTAGADHHAPQRDLDDALAALSAAVSPDPVRRSSLATFAGALAARAAARPLDVVRGELRDSYGYAWTLQGTTGTRAALKRRYAVAERALVRDTEPWLALARRSGGPDRRHLLRAAWRPILHCQPHDTLCGCSIDAVGEAMRSRLDDASASMQGLRDESMNDLLGQGASAARRARERWTPVVIIRNAAARARTGVAEIAVDRVLAESPVGPGSAGVAVAPVRLPALWIGVPPVALQELARERLFVREESPHDYPRNRLVERRRAVAWVADVPGYGLLTLPVGSRRASVVSVPTPVSADTSRLLSENMAVELAVEGLTLRWRDGRAVHDWLGLEAEGEKGDLYTASPIPGTRVVAAPARGRVTARGPLRGEITAGWRLQVPERRLTSATGRERRLARQRVDARVAVQLDAGASFVRLVVTGVNHATDVRVRLVIRTGLPGARVVADAAFGPVAREPVIASEATTESAPRTAPLHRYVSLFNDQAGASLFSDGLAEYEVLDDGSIAVTLFRAVGELSRHDLPERPGHAGYPAETPSAQEVGPFEARLGFALHGPPSPATVAAIEAMADEVLHPLVGDTLRTAVDPPGSVAGFELEGEGLAFSAAKDSEDGKWMVLRCANLLDQVVEGRWRLTLVSEAMLARLDETPLEPLPVHAGVVRFPAPPRGIVTVLVR